MEITRTSLPSVTVPLRETPPTRSRDDATAPSSAAAPTAEASLWDVLTPEEREFFAQQATLGPMRYGPRRGTESSLGAPLGRRLDVRG